jgi:hypothetical protein
VSAKRTERGSPWIGVSLLLQLPTFLSRSCSRQTVEIADVLARRRRRGGAFRFATTSTLLPPQRYLAHRPRGNPGHEPDAWGGRRCRAGGETVRHWVMNPQVRALTETKGNGPVLRRGKNAGGARETAPRTKLKRCRPRAPLPTFSAEARCESRRGDDEARG